MTVLVVAAHPDDEVLGAGATVAKLVGQGRTVHSLILGEGVTSRTRTRAQADRHQVDDLRAASSKAATHLGSEAPVHAGLPDNRFDSIDLLDVVKLLEGELERVLPDLVLTHHSADLNVDHQVTARAVLTATRPQPNHTVKSVMCFETPSATEWGFGQLGHPFVPSVYVDVTETIATKLAALRAYEAEMRPFPHARSLEGVEALARRRGTEVGLAAAEAFQLVRAIR